MILQKSDFNSLLGANHPTPHDVLGLHEVTVDGRRGMGCWALLPEAASCEVVRLDKDGEERQRYPMGRLHQAGLFECFIEGEREHFAYRLRVVRNSGEIRQFYNPYSFLPTLSEDDIYLINQGNHHHIYRKLGCHPREINGVKGFSFSVWAPSAKAVSVVGGFNNWDARYYPMRRMGSSGIWELFIPGVENGSHYKYRIKGRDGQDRLKTDPYGTYFEAPPHNASIAWNLGNGYGFEWSDQDWIAKRAKDDASKKPVSIYEVHFGSWKRVVEDGNRPLTYREMAHDLCDYVKQMGFTHVEFMPLMEHPFDGSWGYQVTGFFAPTQRYGTPQDFQYLVNHLHNNGIGVILDWVPAHFPRDAFALAEFDGTHLFEHADPRKGAHMDWGTLIFNYGRHEVRNFLVGSALAWFDLYHIDGLRVDAVASMLYLDYSRKAGEWIPNQYGGRENIEAIEFLRQVNDLAHKYHPGTLMIAEESTAFGGVTKPTKDWGLGFDLKWNMGWMHDTLQYMKKEPIHRKYHHNDMTFGMLYQYSEKFVTVFSHDEVVHGKGSLLARMAAGLDIRSKSNDLRTLYAWMWAWPGKKCLFMSCEFGQNDEWSYDESIQWHLLQYHDHAGIQLLIKDLNHWFISNPSLAQYDFETSGFEWINGGDVEQSVYTFLRKGQNPTDTFAVIANFTPVPRQSYRFGVPYSGHWQEVINTNAQCYGGTGHGNYGGVDSEAKLWDGRENSLPIHLPGHTVLIFKYAGKREPEAAPRKRSASKPSLATEVAATEALPPAEQPRKS